MYSHDAESGFITVHKVSKDYSEGVTGPSIRVLSDVNLQIREGEFICLMGQSGSGKSTLLTILGGMNHPSGGKVLIDGIDVYGLNDERRADFRTEYLGFVFQQHHLMPYLNALENAMLPLATQRIPSREKRDRGRAVLEKVVWAQKRGACRISYRAEARSPGNRPRDHQ